MKILHTADWHIGLKSWKIEKETDRTQEIIDSLDQILEGAESESVDLIIISGDVLHENRNPSTESLSILMKYLSEFSKIAPTVVVMGNHDWKGLLSYSYVAPRDLYISGKPEEIVIDTNSGKADIYTVPYVRGTPSIFEGNSSPSDKVARLIQKFAHSPTSADYRVLTSHIMVEKTGVIPPTVEESIQVILKPENFSALFDYIALGHVHRHVVVKDTPPVVYSGSIIQNDFSEWKDKKGYIIVEKTLPRFVEISYKKLVILDLSNEKSFQVVREKIEEASQKYDYIKVKINQSLSHYRGTILRFEKVRSVSVESINVERIDFKKEFEGMNFDEIFEEYIKRELSGELLNEALKILRKVKGEGA